MKRFFLFLALCFVTASGLAQTAPYLDDIKPGTLGGDNTFSGNLVLQQNLSVASHTTLNTASATGNVTVGGTLGVTGQLSGGNASFTGDISQIPRAGYLGGSFVQNVSLADNATATLSCVGAIGGQDGPTGHIYIANTIGGSSGAIFWVQGTNIAEITGNSSWTTTKDTDTKYNIYAEGGYFVLQNMAGATRNLPVVFVGIRK